MAPKKASSSTAPKVAAQPSAGPLLITANFITGARVVVEDLNTRPYSRAVVDWLNTCGLLELCTVDVPQFSLLLADEFHKKIKVTLGTGKLQGKLRNQEVVITPEFVGQTFGILYNTELPMAITDEELRQAWELMRPGVPMIGASYTRKEFSPEVYLLSDIVDKVLLCKTGNKDKFTEDQLRITAAIFMRRKMNWAGLLHHQICQSILTVAQSGSPKCKFVRLINFLVAAACPNLPTSNAEITLHSSAKEINKTTLKFLEKVVPAAAAMTDSEEIIPETAAPTPTEPILPAPTASHSKAKGKGK